MPLRGQTVESMNFGVIATGNQCDFNALRAAPRSLHGARNLPYYRVIARSEAEWRPEREARGSTLGVQSPGAIHRNAPQKQTLYREIPTGPPPLGMTENL